MGHWEETQAAAKRVLEHNVQTFDDAGQFQVAIQVLLITQGHRLTKEEALRNAVEAITLAYDGGQ
jgi:hypothetical protein